MLYIFLHGMSWYNKFGFVSKNFANEQIINKEKLNTPFDDFIKNIFEKEKEGKINNIKDYVKKLSNIQNMQNTSETLLRMYRRDYERIIDKYQSLELYEQAETNNIQNNKELDYQIFLNKYSETLQ